MLTEPNIRLEGRFRCREEPDVTEPLSASLEDYLEAVLHLEDAKDSAHVKDIARRLGVKMPSVTGALRSLAEKELVNYRPYEAVTLTRRGREIASEVSNRHSALTDFMREVLGLEPTAAEENACRIEHVVDDIVLERLAAYLDFARMCPLHAVNWEGAFGRFCEGSHANCEQQLKQALERLGKKRKGT